MLVYVPDTDWSETTVNQRRRSSKGKVRLSQSPPLKTHRLQETIPRAETNSRLQIRIVPKELSPDGRPGYYDATFVLVIPGKQTFLEGLRLDRLERLGDSL